MTARNPRRPRARVLVARWSLVLSLAAVLGGSVLAALGVIPTHGTPTPATSPCVVVGYAMTDHAVLCADGSSRFGGTR
jgi:hypothetical protein